MIQYTAILALILTLISILIIKDIFRLRMAIY